MENVAGEGSVSVSEDLVCLLWEGLTIWVVF